MLYYFILTMIYIYIYIHQRPEWLVLVTILIPPPLIRPTTSISDGSRTKGHDDLTSLLREISKYNIKLIKLKRQYKEKVSDNSLKD